MSAGTLYTWPTLSFGKRLRAAAVLAGVTLDLPACTYGETNKTPEFLAKFPHGKVPAFEGQDGFKLFETTAIARYIATLSPNNTLLGAGHHEAALVDQWVSYADNEVRVPMSNALYITDGKAGPYSKPIDLFWRQRVVPALETVESHLQNCTFLVGERISLADITLATTVQQAFSHLVDAPARAKLPNLVRWYETVVNQPALKDIFGETVYVQSAVQYQAPKKEKEAKPAKAATGGVAAAASSAVGAVQSAASAAVAAVKPKSKKKDEDEDEDEPLVPPEPKVKNPLDDLPKSSFNLEDWKRAYSNMETKGPGGAVEWFYEHFDKEGYSVWRMDFKYNEELTQVFMSSNQIGGFFNRLEGSRKYLFGSVGVLGTANNSIITGVLICRGQDFKPVVEVAPDWESYEYKLLEPQANPDDKKFFEDALAWDLEVGGKTWADGKNFK